MADENYPIPAFYFSVRIGLEAAEPFRDVEGIGATIETAPVEEGGENGFIRAMPKKVNFTPLVLKRPIASKDSPLTHWCDEIFDRGLANKIETRSIEVALLDESGESVRQWSFIDAYPTGWTVESFGATKNEIAIEAFTFNYHDQKRVI